MRLVRSGSVRFGPVRFGPVRFRDCLKEKMEDELKMVLRFFCFIRRQFMLEDKMSDLKLV